MRFCETPNSIGHMQLLHLAVVLIVFWKGGAALSAAQEHNIAELKKDVSRTRYTESPEDERTLTALLVKLFTEHPEYHFYQVHH